MLYDIFAGIIGEDYNGAMYQDTVGCESESDATDVAMELACTIFDESNIYDKDQLLEENPNLTEEDLFTIYLDLRTNSIEYYAIEVEEDDVEEEDDFCDYDEDED